MRFLLSTLLAASLASFQFACSSAKKETEQRNPPVQTPSEKYRLKAEEKLRENIDYVFNSDSTFVLCLKQSKPTNEYPQRRVSFFVYDLSENSVVYENVIENGNVSWHNNEQIDVSITPGIVTGDDRANERLGGFFYDVKMKRTILKGAGELQKQD